MKGKFVCVLVCMLMIAITVFPVEGITEEKTICSTAEIPKCPILNIIGRTYIYLDTIPIKLENVGTGTAENISWEAEVDNLIGSLSLSDESGNIPSLVPGNSTNINLGISGFGIGTILVSCSYTIGDEGACGEVFEVKNEWADIGLSSLHILLSMFPKKEWEDIENVIYVDESDDIYVEFHHEDILNCHNVRVITTDKSDENVEFLAACKFTEGNAKLYECHMTQNITDATWQVELVSGK